VAEDPELRWERKVAVYTGILPVAKNDDGLAAVMGHEIAPTIARHGAERGPFAHPAASLQATDSQGAESDERV
jgi:predicted Zn-dependent protease